MAPLDAVRLKAYWSLLFPALGKILKRGWDMRRWFLSCFRVEVAPGGAGELGNGFEPGEVHGASWGRGATRGFGVA